ncbi:MAG: hypothetical protein JO369_05370 [Paucibacter sp.]|nr:hypothetical protein [Roseateles sp.]
MMLSSQYSFLPPPASHFSPEDAPLLRAVCAVAREPWFIATFRVGRGRVERIETIGFTSDAELLLRLKSRGCGRLTDLVCLMPPWCSGSDGWSTRRIASVWLVEYLGAEHPLFIDVAGDELCGVAPDAELAASAGRRLVRTVDRVQGPA